ncbi:MAG TPA: cytochrome c [Acidobacteriaceae bacterium]|nr:cytochrome c [Acidobacteriaceae bacterium]
MTKDHGRILGEHTAERWRAPVGRILLAAAVAMAAMSAWMPEGAVHAFSRKKRAEAEILFREKGCEHCHGVDGVGTELGPSLNTVGKRLSKAQIEQQIKDGGKQMPAFGDVLSQAEVKNLVDYLVHKKKAPKGAPKAS